jgi:predicted dehydrogenase
VNRPRIAVVGVGHLGRIHAHKLASMPGVDLVAVVDSDEKRREEVAGELGTRAAKSHLELTGDVDAAIVATPAKTHYRIAKELLERRIHTFVEKPLTTRLPEADHLVDLAEDRGMILQVGHVERFNPAWGNVKQHIEDAKYIEARRTGGFTFRAVDVGVVLDLMIHDIDLVLQMADSEIIDVDAFGVAVLGRHEDIAQARLRFANGCVADLCASRMCPTASRTMNIFCPTMFAKIDFANHSMETIRPQDDIAHRRFQLNALTDRQRQAVEDQLFETVLQRTQMEIGQSDALSDELRDFLDCVRHEGTPQVTGADGRNAIAVAETIIEQVAMHRWTANIAGPSGPLALPTQTRTFQPRIWPAPAEVPQRKAG